MTQPTQPPQSPPSALVQLLQDIQRDAREQRFSPGEQQQMIQTLALLLQKSASAIEQALPHPDMQQVRGQEHVKRALEVAAAGGHSLLLVGPPGAGKRWLAQALFSLLPPLSDQTPDPPPLRAPPATMELDAFVGKADPPLPGELTLANAGLLLLENLSAFPLPHLKALQQAVEKHVVIPQGAEQALFPARFLLVATMPPCPCGWYGDPIRECTCLAEELVAYRQRLSEVISSCFDLQVEVPYVRPEALLDKPDRRSLENSASIRRRVEAARARQRQRFAGTRLSVNSDLRSLDEGQRSCAPGDAVAQHLLQAAIRQMHLSAWQVLRIERVSRSIADLAQSDSIAAFHLAEAIHYLPRFGR